MTRLNGETLQQGEVSDLIFPIAELIAYISAFTLSPGDVIATGTPEGVGSSRKPPRFMAQATRWKWTFPAWHAGQPGDGRARPGTSRTRRRAWLMRCCT